MDAIIANRAPAPESAGAGPVRVLITDDSAVVRGILVRTLEANPDIEIVGTVSNGKLAVETVQRQDIDVVLLDIEMPVMDGLTALGELMAYDRGLKVIMISTLTHRNADITMKALRIGASDYLTKPGRAGEILSNDDFSRSLIEKILALGTARRRGAQGRARPAPATVPARATAPVLGTASPAPTAVRPQAPIALKKPGLKSAELIAIGSSNGGPQALLQLLAKLKGKVFQPILITQHMPPTFTALLSEHIQRHTGFICTEAANGDAIVAGRVYVAPGGQHMTVGGPLGGRVVKLDTGPPENFCRPSVDVMMRSLVHVYDGHILGVILTGMGHDGLEGCKSLVAAGGTVVAQDEATSVVWGMPAAVAQAGICSAVLPLDDLPDFIQSKARGYR